MDRELAKLFENIVESSGSATEFYSEFNSCATYKDKIESIKKFYEWEPPELEHDYKKNAATSTVCRESGNRAYVTKKNVEALTHYNLALRYAPVESKELGLAFANRSAVFQAQGKFKQALEDIHLALKYSYPEDLIPKLNLRIENCKKLLLTEAQLKNGLNSTLEQEKQRRRTYCDNILFKLQTPNPKIENAEDFVKIEENVEFGRHVVVTKDVDPGTILLVEEPYAFTLKNEYAEEEIIDHCSQCLKSLEYSGIPCSNCTFAFFCDEKCRTESEKSFHKYECPCSPYIKSLEMSSSVLLAWRIICKTGPEELHRIFQTKDPKFVHAAATHQNLKKISGFDPETGIYDSSKYLSVFHLIDDHGGEHSDIESIMAALEAVILARVLEKYSNFFTRITEDRTEFMDFISSLILQHIYTVSSNSMSLHEIPWNSSLVELTGAELLSQMKSLQFSQVGTGLYALTSLLNHSCDPNIARINDLRRGTMSVIALKPLRAGDQLFNCYSTFFGTAGLNERQSFLKTNYNFQCSCSACVNDWPLLSGVSRAGLAGFNCTSCSGVSLAMTSDKKYGRCPNCKQKYSLASLTAQLKKAGQRFQAAYKLTLENKALDALEPLCETLAFQRNLKQPFIQGFVAQETFKQALGLIVSLSQ